MPVFSAIAAVAGAVSSIGAGAAGLFIGTAAAGGLAATTTTLIGGALIGATIGGVTAAIKGDNIFGGILKGGLIGAAAGGALGFAAEAIGTAELAGTEGATALTGAGGVSAEASAEAMAAGEGLVGQVTPEIAEQAGLAAGETGVSAAGELAKTVTGGAVKGGVKEAGKSLLGAFTGKNALIGAATVNALAGLFAPSEEDQAKKLLEEQAKYQRISGLGKVQKVAGTVDWNKYDINNWMDDKRVQSQYQKLSTQFSTDNAYRLKPSMLNSQLVVNKQPQVKQVNR